MIILGVDPGTLITGYGVIEFRRGKLVMQTCDVIKNASNRSMPIRLKRIYDSLVAVIERYHPDEFAIETAFYGKNPQSALKIGHARGVAILAAVNHQIPTAEYSPREVKKAVTGNGAASKQQVSYMIRTQLQLREPPKYFDASDALAVAVCHVSQILPGFPKYRTVPSTSKNQSWTRYVHEHPERIV